MKTVSFAIQKGGTGKTSISTNTARQLALDGYKTLLIDADPQGNATGAIINNLNNELADVLFGDAKIDQAILKTSCDNLYILPTAGLDGRLRLYSETQATQKPFALKQALKTVSDNFDYVIIDTSPAFTGLEKQCFIASDSVIPVLQLDIFSLDGIAIFLENIATLKKDMELQNPAINTLVVNARDNRLSQQTEVLNTFQNYKLNLAIIPVDQAFKKAQGLQVFIQDLTSTKKETLDAIAHLAQNLN